MKLSKKKQINQLISLFIVTSNFIMLLSVGVSARASLMDTAAEPKAPSIESKAPAEEVRQAPRKPTYAFSIETGNLTIRNLTEADRSAVNQIMVEEDAGPKSGQEFDHRHVNMIMNHPGTSPSKYRDFMHFAVEDKATGKVIGILQLAQASQDPGYAAALGSKFKGGTDSFAVGYFLAKEARGKKFCTEAISKLKDYAFNTLKIKQLVADTAPGNSDSQRALLSSKVGFVLGTANAASSQYTGGKANYYYLNAPEEPVRTVFSLVSTVQTSVSHVSTSLDQSTTKASTVVRKTLVFKTVDSEGLDKPSESSHSSSQSSSASSRSQVYYNMWGERILY